MLLYPIMCPPPPPCTPLPHHVPSFPPWCHFFLFPIAAPSSSNVVLAIGATTITSGADSVSPMNLQQPLAVNTIGREVYSYSSSRPGVLQKMNINGRNQLVMEWNSNDCVTHKHHSCAKTFGSVTHVLSMH